MRYWVYLNGQVPGSYDLEDLVGLPGFAPTTLVCPAEGEISESSWTRAGEIPDIIRALGERRASAPEAAGPASAAPVAQSAFDAAGARLISQVAELSKEFETRREERSLLASLQTHLLAMKEELDRERRTRVELESRLERLGPLEENLNRSRHRIRTLEEALKAKDEALIELRAPALEIQEDLERERDRLRSSARELAARESLIRRLNGDLAEKESGLAKALALVRKLEADLSRVKPGASL